MGGNGGGVVGPKILLAKPGLVVSHHHGVGVNNSSSYYIYDDSSSSSVSSSSSSSSSAAVVNLLSSSSSDSFPHFLPDRFLPFLTDNTDFTVVGVIGPPGVGKSTILNQLYGFFDGTSPPGMLPPLATQTEEIRAQARHCTVGIEPRITAERIILLDTQPVFSPSILADITRPDGSSTVPGCNGEPISAELSLELMGIQISVLLASICHVIVVVSDGVHDINMWRLMSTVDLLKHGIPDPSSPLLSHSHTSSLSSEKESKDKFQEAGEEYIATPVFVHTKLQDQDLTPHSYKQLQKALIQYFSSSSFMSTKPPTHVVKGPSPKTPKLFLLPYKSKDDSPLVQYESYASALWKLRDQVLSMNYSSFGRTVSERDWLKNSAKIWDLIKNSSIIAEYVRMLQNSGLFRR